MLYSSLKWEDLKPWDKLSFISYWNPFDKVTDMIVIQNIPKEQRIIARPPWVWYFERWEWFNVKKISVQYDAYPKFLKDTKRWVYQWIAFRPILLLKRFSIIIHNKFK